MTPGYDPNKGTDDFRREHGGDDVSNKTGHSERRKPAVIKFSGCNRC